jgi:hypothetical protein
VLGVVARDLGDVGTRPDRARRRRRALDLGDRAHRFAAQCRAKGPRRGRGGRRGDHAIAIDMRELVALGRQDRVEDRHRDAPIHCSSTRVARPSRVAATAHA